MTSSLFCIKYPAKNKKMYDFVIFLYILYIFGNTPGERGIQKISILIVWKECLFWNYEHDCSVNTVFALDLSKCVMKGLWCTCMWF